MKSILAFTQKDDLHTASVRSRVEARGGDIVVLDREAYGTEWVVSWAACGRLRAYIDIGSRAIDVEQIRSCWLRRDFIAEPPSGSTPEVAYAFGQRAIHVNSFLSFLETRVPCLNGVTANQVASSKMRQVSLAMAAGLSVPLTYAGGSPERADRFLRESIGERDACIKALEAVHFWSSDGNAYAHYTSRFDKRPLTELASLRDCPVFLQDLVPKLVEVRATLVGNEVYACSIDTRNASADARVDWRHYDWKNTEHFRTVLPSELVEKLQIIMRSLGISYGAFDLICAPTGDWVFLEVNSMGQWLWIEDLTELAISDGVARWLLNPVL